MNNLDIPTSPDLSLFQRTGNAALLFIRRRAGGPLRHLRQSALQRSMGNFLLVFGVLGTFVFLVNVIVQVVF